MVFKYQIETLKYLDELGERLENLTEKRMSLKIGYMRDDFYSNYHQEYQTRSGDLYLRLNFNNRFLIKKDGEYASFSKTLEVDYMGGYIKLDEDIFLNLNKWIDEIYDDKRKREEFHRKLNKELEALNKSL